LPALYRFLPLFIFTVLLLLTPSLKAQERSLGSENQEQDSVKAASAPKAERIDPFSSVLNGVEYSSLVYDSTIWELEGIQNYHPLHKSHSHFQTTGDPGMPVSLRNPQALLSEGFQSGFYLFDPYLYTTQNARFYTSFAPFSRLVYTQMPRGFTQLSGLFTANINPDWNVSAQFRNITNQGFYLRQRNAISQFQLTSRYRTKNNRYWVQLSLNANRFFNQENGGWENDTLFDQLEGVNKQSTVNLSASSSRFSYQNHGLEQIYWLRGHKQYVNDSTTHFQPKGGIKHKMEWSKTRSVFQSSEQDFAFFSTIYIDSFTTNDSFVFNKNKQELGWVNNVADSSVFSIYTGMGAEFLQVAYLNYPQLTQPRNNYYTFLNASYKLPVITSKMSITSHYFLSGFNAGDYKAKFVVMSDAKGDASVQKKWNYELIFDVNRTTPGFIYNQFLGNHRQWTTTFNAVASQNLQFSVLHKGKNHVLRGEVAYLNMNNTVYLSEEIMPLQVSSALQSAKVKISSRLKWSRFYFKNELTFLDDLGSGMKEYLPFPKWMTYHSWYYQNDLFSGALKFQVGADVRWFSAYYAPAYDPASRLFYLQNRRMQGNYPMLDLFVAGEIKTFRGFVKLEHANFALLDNQFPNLYYSTLDYSLVSRRLVVGIVWKLYN
jgi:hypothetical protein